VDKGKGAGGEEIRGNVQVAGLAGAVGEGEGGEAVGWYVGQRGGQDSVFCRGEGRRGRVLMGMVSAVMGYSSCMQAARSCY